MTNVSPSDLLDARMFKSASGGYIFQPPPATIFTPTTAYHVTEAQKAEILTIVRARRAAVMRAITLAALLLAITTGILIVVVGGAPLFVSIFIALCVNIIAQIAGTSLMFYLQLRQLDPILANLPHSDERLFPPVDLHRRLFAPPSPRWAAFWCGGAGIMLGYRSAHHLPFTSVSSTTSLIIFAVTLFWAIQTTRQTTRGSAPSSNAVENS